MADAVDVVVVGAGPAGLAAALMLGRCRRRVAVVDAGSPRNAASAASHGYLTRDGVSGAELRALGRAEAARYGARFLADTVIHVAPLRKAPRLLFRVQLASGAELEARRVVLATGVHDVLPDLPGVAETFGRGLCICPYCDAFEHAGQPLGVLAATAIDAGPALGLRVWSTDVTVFRTGGAWKFSTPDLARLARHGVRVEASPVVAVLAAPGPTGLRLAGVRLASGAEHALGAAFLQTVGQRRGDLGPRLGCKTVPGGGLKVDAHARTSVPGVYAAGDTTAGYQWLIVAAAEGAAAGAAANADMVGEELP